MKKIVLSGGPCAGKSTLAARAIRELTEKGFYVLFSNEAASNLIMGGIKPGPAISMEEFQDFVLDYQIENESRYEKAAAFFDPEKVIILYDRGLLDQMAYIGREYFYGMLKKRDISFSDARDRYDGVIFLQSAANGAEEYYTQINEFNGEKVEIRYESVDEARELNDRTLNAWIGVPHLRVIGNEMNFEEKIDMAMQEIYNIIGIPVVTEIERKFLIKKPSEELLNNISMCSRTDIFNTYLKEMKPGVERRIRMRGLDGDYSFYYTEKSPIPGSIMRREVERRISQKDYLWLATETDNSLHTVGKHRYCHVYDGQYFEIDVYDFDDEYAILELELGKEEQEIRLPSYIEVVKEVTEDSRYKNKQIAKDLKFPPLTLI